ncbi:MAG: hypothetical protein U1E15_09500 [Hyphomicrobiales bacterium]
MKLPVLPVALAGLWITASEFVRNELLFKSFWTGHYQGLGLTFETKPLNGVLWLVWSMIFACIIQQLLSRFSFGRSVAMAWVAGFPMMWITLFNLQVLPLGLLVFALPLSIVEVLVAALILTRFRAAA